jgi:hypothetical protein
MARQSLLSGLLLSSSCFFSACIEPGGVLASASRPPDPYWKPPFLIFMVGCRVALHPWVVRDIKHAFLIHAGSF